MTSQRPHLLIHHTGGQNFNIRIWGVGEYTNIQFIIGIHSDIYWKGFTASKNLQKLMDP